MIPDFENVNDRMEQASLKDLMPGFDKDAEWLQLSQRLHPAKRFHLPVWSYAAAILLLLAGGVWFYRPAGTADLGVAIQNNAPVPQLPVVLPADTSAKPSLTIAHTDVPPNDSDTRRNMNMAIKKNTRRHKEHSVVTNYTAKDFVCNGTPCPIQICISQTVQCPHAEPATISSCSTLEPDQSDRLRYKAHDKIAKNCSLTINEIEIKSIATGETILLNTTSTPSTAQEVFNYITGKKKGDVLAGMFNSDCNHEGGKHGLRINNRHGDLIIE